MWRSIRTRLTISHLAVIVVAMVLSGFLLLSLLERYFLQSMETSLAAQARITAKALVPWASAGQEPTQDQIAASNTIWQQRTDNLAIQAENVFPPTEGAAWPGVDLGYLADASLELSSQLDTRIRIVDSEGVVRVDSQPEGEDNDVRSDLLVRQALAGQYSARTDASTMWVALPLSVDEETVGVVYLSQPLDDVTAVLQDLRTRWLLSTIIALLLSAVVGLALSQAVTRPLRRLTEAAEAVSRGQLDQQVPVRSRDELGHLSRAFNQMTGRLRAARQMQTDFVANVSHELRTPLTSVKGMVETLRAGAVDDQEVRDRFLQTVESETDRLIRLVNDLLLLSRADSEALDLQRQNVDLVALARVVVGRLASRADARGLEMRVECVGKTPQAWIDPDRIQQVLLNLLDNAIKYSRPGGAVVVSVRAGDPVQVEVRDEGIGIPGSELARVGERFYRTDRARSRAEGGSGLGLAIAQALVQAHGGQLWLESHEGRGTTVTFSLPVV